MAQTRAERYEQQRKLIMRAERYWGKIHKSQDERIRFLLDGEHYDDDDIGVGADDLMSKDRRTARWVGQEAFNVYRHEIAAAFDPKKNQVFAKPLDEGGNEALGEIAVASVNSHIEDPLVMWPEMVEDVISSASACGVGWARLADFDPNEGAFGQLFDESGDPRQFMWDPRAKSIHERRCEWVIIRRRETVRRALTREGWDRSVVKKLQADEGGVSQFAKTIETSDKLERHGPVANQAIDQQGVRYDDEFTYYEIWERLPGVRTEQTAYAELAAGDRYMVCHDCGYQSPTQDELAEQEDQPDLELPEMAQGPCPGCGSESPLERHDATATERTVRGYPNLHLTLIAPYSGPKRLIFDGEPEIAYRTYPFMHLTRFRHPTKPIGPSIASLNEWNQLCVDLMMTLAIERFMESAPIWSVPDDGITDVYGQAFEFTDENGRVLKRDSSIGAQQIEVLEGTGLPAAWSQVYANAMNALTAKTGIMDFGLGESQSRDIPAGSVAQQIQQQEIPLGHYQRRIQREIGRSYGVEYDGLRATDSDEKLKRLRGADGEEFTLAYRMTDVPNFDFYLDDVPDYDALDEAKNKGLALMIQTMQTSPAYFDIVAAANHIPPSEIRKFKQAAQAAQQKLAAPPQSAAGVAGAGGAPPGAASSMPAPQGAPASAGAASPQDMVAQLIASLGGGGMGPQPATAP